ncbi:MAG TPA: FGGY family carbohydrate kinase [Gaiellaceae bacterium]|jgi:gluconokinase
MAQVLALDIGSSSVRAQRFDERGNPDGELRQEKYETSDAAEVAELVRKVLGGEEPDGTSSFGHSLVALDKQGEPLTPILGWRDTRSADAAEWLRRRLDADAVHARTGGFLHPSYWAAKLAWLAQVDPDVFREADCFVSFVDYVRGSRETSASMASGTGLLDLTANEWDGELLDALGLDPARLPTIADVPVWLDGVCSNLGAGCVGLDRAALMVGTSGAMRILYETERPQPRDGLFMYRVDGRRVCEGGALSDGGNLYAWLEQMLVERGEARDDHGLIFLPFLGGERSTGWDPHQTGALLGLTFDTTPADIRRAALEGVGFRFAAIADLLPDVHEIVATGGALVKDHEWVQLLADTLARPVTLSGIAEASLRGAAVAVLENPDDAPLGDTFHPREERAEAYRWARERQDRLYEVLRGEL